MGRREAYIPTMGRRRHTYHGRERHTHHGRERHTHRGMGGIPTVVWEAYPPWYTGHAAPRGIPAMLHPVVYWAIRTMKYTGLYAP